MDATAVGFVAAVTLTAGATLERFLGRRSRFRRIDQFLQDWSGTPARPGVARRPGVLERLATHDERLVAVDERLGVVETRTAQLERNGGSSLADTVHEMARQLTANQDSLADIARRVVEARSTAGEAAVVAARVEELHRRDHNQLVRLLEEMRDRIWERFAEQDGKLDAQRLRELTYVSMLHELGIHIELPAPDDESDD